MGTRVLYTNTKSNGNNLRFSFIRNCIQSRSYERELPDDFEMCVVCTNNEKSFTCPNTTMYTNKAKRSKATRTIAIGVFLMYSHLVRDLLEMIRFTGKSLTLGSVFLFILLLTFEI